MVLHIGLSPFVILVFSISFIHEIELVQGGFDSPYPGCSGSSNIQLNFKEAATISDITGDGYKQFLGIIGNDSDIILVLSSIQGGSDPNDIFETVYETVGDAGQYLKQKAIVIDIDPPNSANSSIVFNLRCTPINDSNYEFELRDYTVNVTIYDANDNSPEFSSLPYFATIYETAPIGTTIFTGVAAIDIDQANNSVIKFSIVSGDNSVTDASRYFTIDPDSGVIQIQQNLDLESLYAATSNNVYDINLQATDQADVVAERRSTNVTLTLNITDTNDLPPAFIIDGCFQVSGVCFNPEYRTNIAAGPFSTSNLIIYKANDNTNTAVEIKAEDRDVMKQDLQFSIEETIPTGYKDHFVLANASLGNSIFQLLLKTQTRIDRNVIQSFKAIIKVEETSGKFYERAVLHVTVTPINTNNPLMTSSTGSLTGFIWEDVDPLDFVKNQNQDKLLRLMVTDADILVSDPPQSYTFTTSPSDVFNVDSDGYVILVRTSGLDYETDKNHTISVTVTEKDTVEKKNSSVDITVHVLDINDNRPIITARRFESTIEEGDYSGTSKTIVSLTYIDADAGENAQVVYSLDQVIPDQPTKFSVATNGVVAAIGVMVLGDRFSITVACTDKGDHPRNDVAIIGLTVISSGNKAPIIPETQYRISVCEGNVIGSSLFTVPATDYENETLTYGIKSGDSSSSFIIDANGVLKNSKMLDRETDASFNLVITVTDPHASTDTTRIVIAITDINDNTPQFAESSYTFSVDERVIKTVGTVGAIDKDEANNVNSQIIYSIYDAQDMFVIDSTSGVISNSKQLDWETQQKHIFLVLAVDSVSDFRRGSAVVEVIVNDVKDSVPIFNPVDFEVTFPEAKINSLVVTVTASDADAIKDIVYAFDGGDHSNFNINANTGEITVITALSYSTKQSHSFKVSTTDGKMVAVSSATATVVVRVENQQGCIGTVEDLSPVFVYPTCPTTTDGSCISPEYQAMVITGTSSGSLSVFPEPSNTPKAAVAIKSKDPNTAKNAITYSILQTIPNGYESYFAVSTVAPTAGSDGTYEATVTIQKQLNKKEVPNLRIILVATEASDNKLQTSAVIDIVYKVFYITGDSMKLSASYIITPFIIILTYITLG